VGYGRAMDPLVQAALEVREHAQAALTGVKVGAALQAADGTIFAGCNVESRSGIVHVCAERNALWHAISQGYQEFAKIAVVGDFQAPIPPCGYCRQALLEYAPQIEILMATTAGQTATTNIADLMPFAYNIDNRADR
jgi:cytidine deaminase